MKSAGKKNIYTYTRMNISTKWMRVVYIFFALRVFHMRFLTLFHASARSFSYFEFYNTVSFYLIKYLVKRKKRIEIVFNLSLKSIGKKNIRTPERIFRWNEWESVYLVFFSPHVLRIYFYFSSFYASVRIFSYFESYESRFTKLNNKFKKYI